MRNKLGATFSLVGGFLVIVAVLGMFYAPGQLMKTPLDVNTTTDLVGTAELSGQAAPVRAWSVTHTDSESSDDDVAVWVNSSCLVRDEGEIDECVSAGDPQERLISATTDNFASDRVTGLAVNDPAYLPAEAQEHAGLVNKFPFESEKRTYPYWDGLISDTVDATYDRTEEVDGLEVYVYRVSVIGEPIEIVEGVAGTYDDQKEIWVEPLTGSIVNQIDNQVRLDEEGEPVLDLRLGFTPEQVTTSVAEAASDADKLRLVTQTVPRIGLFAGVPLALVGVLLLVPRRRPAE